LAKDEDHGVQLASSRRIHGQLQLVRQHGRDLFLLPVGEGDAAIEVRLAGIGRGGGSCADARPGNDSFPKKRSIEVRASYQAPAPLRERGRHVRLTDGIWTDRLL